MRSYFRAGRHYRGSLQNVAVEAKWVRIRAKSIRNPESPIGSKPVTDEERIKMVEQARKYSEGFDGGEIHPSNNEELIDFCEKEFDNAGIVNVRFVLTE